MAKGEGNEWQKERKINFKGEGIEWQKERNEWQKERELNDKRRKKRYSVQAKDEKAAENRGPLLFTHTERGRGALRHDR